MAGFEVTTEAGGNIAWLDALDGKTSPQQNATPAQQSRMLIMVDAPQVIEKVGRPGEIRTPDPRFRKPLLYPSELQALNHNRVTYGKGLQW